MATKVLVFESDPAFAGELRSELGKLGCSTTVVDDGNVGLQQASSDRPDLILLSIELPRMNGFSVCNKLKKDPGLKDVPLVIMSSESSDETFEQHKKLRTRAEDYVHKPIAFGELLRHIQTFVPLGSQSHRPDADSAIVIDDDIEVGSTDYMSDDDGTQIAPRPSMAAATATTRGMESVDADVDAFADAAFGRLTGSEPPGAGAAVPEARPIHNGAPDSMTATAPAPRRSHPPGVRAPSRPPTTVDVAEYEKLREDLMRARDRAGQIEQELGEARGEVEKLRIETAENERLSHEVEELRSKLAAGAPKTGGISSREFLDLREALNKKDKEILSLKEQLSKKDREIVEAHDRALTFERAKSDLDDKSLALERELSEAKEKAEALQADKDLAKKASEDFKSRAEKARAEAEGKERQLVELRAKSGEDQAAAEARLGALRSELDQTLANERAEHARALDESEERRRQDLDQAKRDRDAALAEAREQGDRERQEELANRTAQLKQEHDGKLASLHRAQQQELEKTRSEAQARIEAESAATRKAKDEELAAARADAERHEQEALEALATEHAEKIKSLENDRDARLAAIESRLSREISEANDKLAKIEMDFSAARGELSTLREAKETGDAKYEAAAADLRATLADVTSARAELDKKHSAASDRVAALEGELASARQDLGEARQKLAAESARADKAHAKWEADRQSLERAKDAMAVALAQIEEAEARS
jgi:CheY-like chemotaxis protein